MLDNNAEKYYNKNIIYAVLLPRKPKGRNSMDLDKLKGLRRNLLLLSLLELVFGLFMIIMNDNSLEIMIVAMGVVAASYGIVNFFAWLIKKEKDNSASAVLILVLGILAGAMLIVFRDKITPFFTLTAGILAGIFGIIKFPNMVSIKKAGFSKWWVILLLIFIIVGMGIIIGLNALNAAFTSSIASVLLGVALVLGSAADIFAMAGTSDVQKQLLAIEGEVEVESEKMIEEKK